MVRISVLAHKVRGEDKKKVFDVKSLALSCRSLVFFAWNETSLTLGGQKQYFGETQAPKCSPEAPSQLLSFTEQYSLGGAFLVRGGSTSSHLGRQGPEMPPRSAGPGFNTELRLQNGLTQWSAATGPWTARYRAIYFSRLNTLKYICNIL